MPDVTVNFTTPRGNTYVYYAHPIGTSFKSEGGNYMFAYQRGNVWYPAYVGQTNNLNARISNHEKLPTAIRHGATHVLSHLNASEQARKTEEAELIAWLRPVCNDLLK